ncbi:TPA: VOC family protein [Klebsiella quasipneumoniae subsp. quasipneumoniae]|nr:VOC family protein [Klebsiella quasipneumoniae subsp. quasipneumoniae]
MKLASVRLITADIKPMVAFYEMVTLTPAQWLAPVFAEIVTPSATLAIGALETVDLFEKRCAEAGQNRTATLEFQVNDIDAEYERLKGWVSILGAIKMMPWGNRMFQFRDPEGTLVAFYMPASDDAKERFAKR